MAKKKKQSRSKSVPGRDEPFSACREELLSILKKDGYDLDKDIITSRDKFSKKLRTMLHCDNALEGFSRSRLPFFFQGDGVNFYLSTGVPNTKVATHSHKHGPVVRFILEGSITFRKQELSTGDWIYLPAGKRYTFTTGTRGASFILGYECCCG